jgi:hypothetical protein
MPRYRVAARFGPWKVGDEFESEDPAHARMAEGGPLVELSWTGYPVSERAARGRPVGPRAPPPAAPRGPPPLFWGPDEES